MQDELSFKKCKLQVIMRITLHKNCAIERQENNQTEKLFLFPPKVQKNQIEVK